MSETAVQKPNPIDEHVGRRISAHRKLISVSQTYLGNAIGVTFQQIQKYERGATRVSASRLYRIAKAMGVDVAYFFEDLPSQDGKKSREKRAARFDINTILSTAEGVELCTYFPKIEDRTQRQQIARLVRSIAEAAAQKSNC